MRDSLLNQLKSLCHGSQEAVQSGAHFSELDKYLHVKRPIDNEICNHMDEILRVGGGILLLVGSAGDGKSHMISYLKSIERYKDFVFYNDATEGCSPQISAVETLKFALGDYRTATLNETSSKTVLAVNIGKLQDLVDNDEFREGFADLYTVADAIANNDIVDDSYPRIKVVSFAHRQAFELILDEDVDYPIKSDFMSEIMYRITQPILTNPFYNAYLETKATSGTHDVHEVVAMNYRLLMQENIRKTIVNLIIEAIVRFKLVLTPREFLDFIYCILVPPKWSKYGRRTDFFSSQLPSLLYDSNGGKIQQAISRLDPLKYSSLLHDNELSKFYASFTFDKSCIDLDLLDEEIVEYYTGTLSQLYNASSGQGDRNNKGNIAVLIFRLNRLVKYESYSAPYKKFLKDIAGYYASKAAVLSEINEMVKMSVPRLYGSYIEEPDFVPLNLQGSNYKIFTSLQIPEADIAPRKPFNVEYPFIFDLYFNTEWDFSTEQIPLKIDFPLYEHMYELRNGKLSSHFDGEKNLQFSNFVRRLSKFSDAKKSLTIVDSDNNKHKLTNKYNQIQLH